MRSKKSALMMRFSRRTKRPSEINLAPFIDVVFLLLIFFVVPATFQTNANLIVDLPTTEGAGLIDPEKATLTLVIKEDSSFYLDQEILTFDSLQDLSYVIEQKLDGLPSSELVIAADELAPHKSTVLAIEAARMSGFQKIFLQTTLEKKTSP